MKSVLCLAFLAVGLAHAQAPPLPTCTITLNPPTGTGTVSTSLTWTTTNCASAVASGAWSGPKACGGGTVTMTGVNSTRTYKLTVKAPTGPMNLQWTKPAYNTDGSPTTLSGFKLYLAPTAAGVPGATPQALPESVTQKTVYLPAGSAQSAGVKAVRTDTVESEMSNIVTRASITASQDDCEATITVTSAPRPPVLQ